MALVQVITYNGFQVEVGSPAYQRLVDAELIPPETPVTEISGIVEESVGETVAELKARAEALGLAPTVLTKVALEELIADHTGTFGE
jgi:hypothetical protein